MSLRWIIVCGIIFISCGSSPPPPTVGTPAGTDTINGSERIGWDQSAADEVELATFGYAIYLDGTRAEAAGVACIAGSSAGVFSCTARLPTMSAGSHTLELASFVTAGATVLESPRSAALHVVVAAQTAAVIGNAPVLRGDLALRASTVNGLVSPTDIAFAPDGRVFVAERAGRIRVVRDGRLLDEPAIALADTIGEQGQLLAIALDPQFGRTHYLYAIYTAADRSGAPAFTLARFREVSGTLGDRAVLLDNAPAAASSPAAALRFGPDGKLYAAYDDGGDAVLAQNRSSLNGKVLRLNPDGTTPADARGATPIDAGVFLAPIALGWDPPTSTMWVADRSTGAAPFAFYDGALFPQWSGRMLSADALFEPAAASLVSRMAVAPDGAIYYLTAGAIGRLAPDRAP